LEGLEVDGRIILEMILKKWDRRTWIELMWLMKWVVARFIEHGDKSLDLNKAGNFLSIWFE
jgi:hypothetical protein